MQNPALIRPRPRAISQMRTVRLPFTLFHQPRQHHPAEHHREGVD